MLPPGDDPPGYFYLHFTVTGSMDKPLRLTDVVWEYERDGTRFREVVRQELVLTSGTERPE